jgi:acetyltransferase-like isoleucine patch superfamily enzyme
MRIMPRWMARLRDLWQLARGRQRSLLLRWRGAKVGTRVTIGRLCSFDKPWCIDLGDRVTIEDQVAFKIVSDHAAVVVGAHSFIGRRSQLDVLERVEVGAHTVIAPECFIVDHNHGIAGAARIDEQACSATLIHVGSDVWIGVRVTLLPGANVGDGSVVGAHAVVNRRLDSGTVSVGAPARVIGERRRSTGQ